MQSNVDASGKKVRKIERFSEVEPARRKMFPVKSRKLGKRGAVNKSGEDLDYFSRAFSSFVSGGQTSNFCVAAKTR